MRHFRVGDFVPRVYSKIAIIASFTGRISDDITDDRLSCLN